VTASTTLATSLVSPIVMYVGDYSSASVRKIGLSQNVIYSELSIVGIQAPYGVSMLIPSEKVFVSSLFNNAVFDWAPCTATLTVFAGIPGDVIPSTSTLGLASGNFANSNGSLWVTDYLYNKVYLFPSNSVQGTAAVRIVSTITQPIDVFNNGTHLFVLTFANTIYLVDLSTNIATLFATIVTPGNPKFLWVNVTSGNAYVAANKIIYQIDPLGTVSTFLNLDLFCPSVASNIFYLFGIRGISNIMYITWNGAVATGGVLTLNPAIPGSCIILNSDISTAYGISLSLV